MTMRTAVTAILSGSFVVLIGYLTYDATKPPTVTLGHETDGGHWTRAYPDPGVVVVPPGMCIHVSGEFLCPPPVRVENQHYVIDNVSPFDGNCLNADSLGVIRGIEPCTRADQEQMCAPPSKLDDNGDFCIGESTITIIHDGWPAGSDEPYKCRWADRDGHTHDDGTCIGGEPPPLGNGFPPGGHPGDVLADDGKGGWKWVPLPHCTQWDKDGNLVEVPNCAT